MKKTLIMLVTIVAGFSISAQAQSPAATAAVNASTPSIHWMSIEQAQKLNQKHPKKILIDTYTEWCGWCKRLDATTWQDARIVDYLNKNYYAVKFDAESKDSIHFNGKVYHYNPNDGRNGINELAVKLLGSQMAYPTIVVIDESLNTLSVIPGYQTADPMNNIVHYFGDNIYKTVDWTAFNSDPSKYLKN